MLVGGLKDTGYMMESISIMWPILVNITIVFAIAMVIAFIQMQMVYIASLNVCLKPSELGINAGGIR